MFTRFCESRRRFFSLLSLKYLYISFFRSLPAPCLLPCSSLFPPPLRLSSAPAPAVCSVAAVCRLVCPLPPPRPRGLFRPVFCVFIPSGTPRSSPAACRLVSSVWLSSGGCRHSSAIRRKTVWQCGQMQRVYVPGLIPSCLCAAVCSVARSAASMCLPLCVSCCRVSSGGNNSLYASISRAAAMRCSVCNVMLLLSMAIRKVWRCTPIRLDNSTTPTPAAFMCSRI